VQQDDEVLVSALTFIAPVNAIRYVGAWPVLIDAEPEFWQMDIGKVREFLEDKCVMADGETRNLKTGRRVKAIIPVHILGNSVDMDSILECARRFNLKVIEDASEGLGVLYKNKSIGTLGDVGCFSFNGNKIITTGGGGMLVSHCSETGRRAKYLTTQAKDDEVESIHGEIGYNYRLTNLQAAVGCAQLERLDDYIQIKRSIAARYEVAFQGVKGITPMRPPSWCFSSFWMYTILIDESQTRVNSRVLAGRLRDAGIQTRPLWQAMHRSAPHHGNAPYPCPVADLLTRRSISLPCSVGLQARDQDRVISTILSYL
jgi:perosamine synthetase